MLRTIAILLAFILILIFIAIAISLFFLPKEVIRYEECLLLQNKKTGEIGCFGCANNICKDATADWIFYDKPEIGIPYACIETENGCQLIQ